MKKPTQSIVIPRRLGSFHPEWNRVRLQDVAFLNPRRPVIDRSPAAPTTFIQMSAVEPSGRGISRPETRPYCEIRKGYTYFAEGDILFAKITPCMQNGKTAIVRDTIDGIGFGSTEFHVLRPGPQITAEWIHLFLIQPAVLSDAAQHFSGSVGQQRVPEEYLREIDIPLPPLAIQRHIAEQLKAQLAEVDRVRTALHAQVEAAKVLPAASLRAVFGDASHEPSLPKGLDWRPVRLGQVCEIIARQVDPKLPEYSSLPHVNGENIESGTCRLTRVRSAAEDGMTSGKYLFEAGDVLYSKLRPYLRKVALVDFRGLCSADMYPLRPNNTWLDSDYMAWMLVSDGFTRYATQESQRARMPKINREELFAWTFSLPPLPTQRALAARLRTEVAEATELCRALETKLATLDRLPAALLRQVFGGADGFTDAAYLRQ